VNVLAEAAALAAIADREHGRRTLEFVRSERDWLASRIAELGGASPVPSHANFMLVGLEYPAAELAVHLLERKILIRECDQRSVRVAVRTRAENERLLAAWKEFSCER
jgi:histidinol-phosphate/aromatic aminotransferase/cobyric acid decarboxylase-like protein